MILRAGDKLAVIKDDLRNPSTRKARGLENREFACLILWYCVNNNLPLNKDDPAFAGPTCAQSRRGLQRQTERIEDHLQQGITDLQNPSIQQTATFPMPTMQLDSMIPEPLNRITDFQPQISQLKLQFSMCNLGKIQLLMRYVLRTVYSLTSNRTHESDIGT